MVFNVGGGSRETVKRVDILGKILGRTTRLGKSDLKGFHATLQDAVRTSPRTLRKQRLAGGVAPTSVRTASA